MIESYSFGQIKIDGKTYTSDVIIYPNRVNASWWRKGGHCLCLEDLTEVLQDKPEILIIGTGAAGIMQVPKETKEKMEKAGIELHILKTKESCKKYNELLKAGKKVIAALHLTC
ncbi:MAG: Mth938-like domain-containing protein [Candidatus Edwardsbacteria bacterium]